MKVLHLVKTSTGATWAYRLMRDLVQMGDEVHVAMPVDGAMVPLYRSAGIIANGLTLILRPSLSTLRTLHLYVIPT